MSKNSRFKDTYTVTVEGVTTNGYTSSLIKEALTAFAHALDLQYKQVDVTISKAPQMEEITLNEAGFNNVAKPIGISAWREKK